MKTNRKNTIVKLIASVLCLSMLTACGNVTGTFAEGKDADKGITAMLTLLPQTGSLQTLAKETEEPVTEPEETATPEETLAGTSQEIAEVAQEIAEVIPEETPEPEPVETAEPEIIAEMTVAEPVAEKLTETPTPETANENVVIDDPETENVYAYLPGNNTYDGFTIPWSYFTTVHQRPDGWPIAVNSREEAEKLVNAYYNNSDVTDWRHGYTRFNDDGIYLYFYYEGPDYWNTDLDADNLARKCQEITDKLAGMKSAYPDWSSWGNNTYYDNPGSKLDAYISNNNACGGFVKMMSDYAFGCDTPVTAKYIDVWEVLPGDIIFINDHVIMFLGGNIMIDETQPGLWTMDMVQGNVVYYDDNGEDYGVVRWTYCSEIAFQSYNTSDPWKVDVLSRY